MPTPRSDGAALPALGARHLRWAAAVWATVGLLAFLDTPASPWTDGLPFLAAGLSATPTARWGWVVVGVPTAAWTLVAVGLPGSLGAAGVATALAARWAPFPTDRFDPWLGALAGMACTGVAMRLAADLPGLAGTLLLGAGSGVGLVVAAWRHDHPDAPSYFTGSSLHPDSWKDLRHARSLYQEAARLAPDVPTRRGLREVTGWIGSLHRTRYRLDRELMRQSLAHAPASGPCSEDATVRASRRAQQRHVEAREALRHAVQEERERTQAAADQALAWLDHARARLALITVSPNPGVSPDLDDMLDQIRIHEREHEAHRRTSHDMGGWR